MAGAPAAAPPPAPNAPAVTRPKAAEPKPAAKPSPAKAAGPSPVGDEFKPELLKEPRAGKSDDLELIWGVGPKLGAMLNRMGIYHFEQIAVWTPENLAWVDQNLEGFKGRVSRDGWVDQALSNRLTTLHRLNSDVLLVLIGLHVAAVAWHVAVRGRPLLRAMITGGKPAALVPPEQAIAGSRTARAVAIVAMLAGALALALSAAPDAVIALF